MKRISIISLLILIYSASFSQANIVSGAISIQGIARDANNNALVSTNLSITAEVYYLSNNTPVSIELKTGQITTDGFGVFAYVMDISSTSFTKISNTEAYIRVSSGTTKFADEKLRMVPYAIHAQNGVPTGTILPFVGSTAPEGWLICDGRSIPSGVFFEALKSALGNATNVPDLRGMFLRGAGSQTVNGVNVGGNTLRQIQNQEIGSHAHAQQGTITTSGNGDHSHTIYSFRGGNISSSVSGAALAADLEVPAGGNDDRAYNTTANGSHTHTVTLTGNTANNSGTDNRPANYGVTYIIKI
jgi:microcystin-dependent protein